MSTICTQSEVTTVRRNTNRRQSLGERLDEKYYDFVEVLDKERHESGHNRADDSYKKVMAFGTTVIAFYLRCIFLFLALGFGVLLASVLSGR